MHDLKMYYHKCSNGTGYINAISYKGNMLSRFNKETQTTDLSVLNPFVTKIADYYIINEETKEVKHREAEILRMEFSEDQGWILHIDIRKKTE